MSFSQSAMTRRYASAAAALWLRRRSRSARAALSRWYPSRPPSASTASSNTRSAAWPQPWRPPRHGSGGRSAWAASAQGWRRAQRSEPSRWRSRLMPPCGRSDRRLYLVGPGAAPPERGVHERRTLGALGGVPARSVLLFEEDRGRRRRRFGRRGARGAATSARVGQLPPARWAAVRPAGVRGGSPQRRRYRYDTRARPDRQPVEGIPSIFLRISDAMSGRAPC